MSQNIQWGCCRKGLFMAPILLGSIGGWGMFSGDPKGLPGVSPTGVGNPTQWVLVERANEGNSTLPPPAASADPDQQPQQEAETNSAWVSTGAFQGDGPEPWDYCDSNPNPNTQDPHGGIFHVSQEEKQEAPGSQGGSADGRPQSLEGVPRQLEPTLNSDDDDGMPPLESINRQAAVSSTQIPVGRNNEQHIEGEPRTENVVGLQSGAGPSRRRGGGFNAQGVYVNREGLLTLGRNLRGASREVWRGVPDRGVVFVVEPGRGSLTLTWGELLKVLNEGKSLLLYQESATH